MIEIKKFDQYLTILENVYFAQFFYQKLVQEIRQDISYNQMSKNKKGKGPTIYNQIFGDQTQVPFISEYIKMLSTEFQSLKRILWQWTCANHTKQIVGRKDKEILTKYITCQHQYFQYDQYDGSFMILDSLDVNMDQIGNEDIIYKSFKLFKKAKWPIRFNSKFVSRINQYNLTQLNYVLGFVYYLACGHLETKNVLKTKWGYVRPLESKTIPFNRFFTAKIFKEKNIFIHIGVEKVPILRHGVIKRYEFVNYMQFLDILGDQFVQNRNKLAERMEFFTKTIYEDVAKKDHSDQIQVDSNLYNKSLSNAANKPVYLYYQQYNAYTERTQYFTTQLNDSQPTIYHPLPFKPFYVSTSENNTMVFDQAAKRWLSKDHLNYMERKKIAEYRKQINDSIIKRFVDFQSAKTLVELLTKIPNFKVNLTQQQKDVIGQNGNVLVIGRSGTGKTTCAVLRLFSIEMLFKIRLSLYKKKYQDIVKDVRCGSSDIDETFGLHCIFLTASPVLTHEIQRYYKKLTNNIKSELEKKKKKTEQAIKIEEQQKKNVIHSQNEQSFQQLNQQQEQQIKQPQQIKQNQEIIPNILPKTQSQRSAEQIQQQQEINQQFKDIELKQDVNNEEFKEDEDLDDIKNKFEENVKKYNSLYDLDQNDYPGFFTVKSFIMMIDGVLPKPFFIRSKNVVLNQDSKASWHNERKGVMMIQNYYREGQQVKQEINMDKIQEEINYSDEEELEHEYLRQIQLRENKDKQQLTKKLQKNNNKNLLSFQVDYQYFIVHFWPRVVKKYYSSRNITPHLVWTEIYSTIKGSAQAHQYPGLYLTQHAYLNLSSNTFLTKQEKLDIYQTFCQYQRWKISAGGYDIMDTVNYILNYIRYRGYDGPEIHYLMIDEVQDLPHSIVYLLSKTVTYGVFYSGDTAQTIAKGVGFRFCDLKSLFNPKILGSSLNLKAPILKHLTVNFRSHNNILQLANSIVSSLQILFPKTIDRLKKEISNLTGPKPMILSSSDLQLLFYVLCGGQQKKPEQQAGMKKPPLEFGCDQVIIVRDQQSKEKVPSMLQHALCLTIYEAKGLEFNDVILFNFFSETPCPQKWSILKSLHVTTVDVDKDQYEKNVSKHGQQPKAQDQKQVQQEQEVSVQEIFNEKTNTYSVKKIVTNNLKNFKDINDYAELCSELKLLYTAITRPKKTLIIYDDEETSARSSLEKIWQKLDVIQIITKDLVMEQTNKKTNQSEEIKIFKKIIVSTDKSQWKQQGLRMYTRGFFDQAMKCFEKSGNQELFKKAQANKNADQATKKLIQIESQRNAIKQGFHLFKKMNNNELSKYKKKLKSQQAASLKKFQTAARIFEELLMFKQAGQCFFSGKIFEKAFECFCKAFMHKQAAQSLQMQNKYRQAAEYYQKDGNYLKIIQCLDLINQWTLILEKIHFFESKMTEYEKQALLKKYSALALEQLVYQIEFENEEEDKKPENNRVQVIEQQQSDQEQEWDSEEDPQLAAERQYQRKISAELSNPSRKQSQVSEQQMLQIKDSVYQKLQNPTKQQVIAIEQKQEESFSQLKDNTIKQNEIIQEGIKSIDESFGDLNKSQQPALLSNSQVENKLDIQSIQSSFEDLNTKYQNQLEPDLQSIKSLVDPDDIWVKNSISQIHKLHSEYSIIDGTQQNYNLNIKIIKTKQNIVVQDNIMKKIVNIVSIINNSVDQFFKQFKGYQSLITVNKKNNQDQSIDQRPQLSEFQDIDLKFVNIILDTLESFKLFKFCLFVCNRYHLPSKAGRYLVSLGMKYSTNCISNNVVNPILLAPSAYRKIQIQKGILASIALHAIYQNVNADFLKIKITDNEQENQNSLGSYFIQGLILEGLYKKAIFMVNPQQSLKILANYNDFNAYNNIYRQKIKKQQNVNSLTFMEYEPKTKDEIEFTKMLLKKAVFQYCVTYKFQTLSLRYYKEFGNNPIEQSQANRLKQFIIPNYLPFTKLLIEDRQTMMPKLKILIQKGYNILKNGNSLQILDLVSTLLAIIFNETLQENLIQQFDNNAFLQLYRCLYYIKMVIRKIKGNNSINIIQAVFSINQCYRIGYCRSMQFVNDTYSFVHRTSTIANELVQNAKINSKNFAYFFQQDYNYILVKTSRILKIVGLKYENALVKLFNKRIAFYKYDNQVIFYEDQVLKEEEFILKKALSYQIETLGDPKKRAKQANYRKKSKQTKLNSYDFKCHGRQQQVVPLSQSSESQEQDYTEKQYKFYNLSINPKMKYIGHLMVHWFNEQSQFAKEIVEGRYLYGCGLNNLYRQYTTKMGGYNLFDALEFKRFKRVDLFAENILSVYDSLTLYSKHCFLAEILMLLLIQYKTLQYPTGFSLTLSTSNLKYLQNIQFASLGSNALQQQSLTLNQIRQHLKNNAQINFKYINNYICQMNSQQLSKTICQFLLILKQDQSSQYVDFSEIVLAYVLNINNGNEIKDSIRKIINSLAKFWKIQILSSLIDCKSIADYQNKRKKIINSPIKSINQPLHYVEIIVNGNIDKAIAESQFDYQVQGRIIEGKRKAVNKISLWWRSKSQQLKDSKRSGSYLQLAVTPGLLSQKSKAPQILGDLRIISAIHKERNIFCQIDLLVNTQIAKNELLSFYLTTTISSSLDLHFILMNLNKITQYRNHYFKYCSEDYNQLHEYQIQQIKQEINQMLSTIQNWKSDQKWLKDRNINLKKKKVFEVKWMTKNIGLSSILKKRAGLKKQAQLLLKKQIIKRK